MKFDKAMGGYEYIQQHIMNGNLIHLYDQNRMIPNEFTPTAEQRLVEIPEENTAIQQEADDDEIIKIATKYMTGTSSKTNKSDKTTKSKKSAKPSRSQGKVQKKFFMPDNVVTGFQPASSVVVSSDEDVGGPSRKRARIDASAEPDIIDSFLDSDSEMLGSADNSAILSLLDNHCSDAEKKSDLKPNKEHPAIPKSLDLQRNYAPATPATPATPAITNFEPIPKSDLPPSRVLRQPQLEALISKPSLRKKSPSLGVRKRPVSIIDQIKSQQTSAKRASGGVESPVYVSESPEPMNPPPAGCDGESGDDNMGDNMGDHAFGDNSSGGADDSGEDFDDDDEILALARRTQSGEWQDNVTPPSQTSSHGIEKTVTHVTDKTPAPNDQASFSSVVKSEHPKHTPSKCNSPPFTQSGSADGSHRISKRQVFPDTGPIYIAPADAGILTAEESNELYMNYYVPVDEFDLDKCGIPQVPMHENASNFRGVKSRTYLKTLRTIESTCDKQAGALIEEYRQIAQQRLPSMKEVLDFD
ncbi:hypothetical protein JCM33374_g3520 [Metschnikowia sp. JCM 33374]|nr:hypothetical protein JCM33374_g3520 [Metschnikowia sp. JCM 33374]